MGDRRWIPEEGLGKYRERIHKESKFADDYKNLPFKFSKPRRSRRREFFKCVECGNEIYAPKSTIMAVCTVCKKVTKFDVVE